MESRILKNVIQAGEDWLRNHKVDNAAYDSFALISDLLNIDRSYYFLHGNDEISEAVCKEYWNRIEKRANHIPLQHIMGYTEFWKYRFLVNEHVLIPRQDTEILVEEAVKKISSGSMVLDMCTGSGCILISLALETHFHKGIGVDISKKALETANRNKEALQAHHVDFLESNLFDKLQGTFESSFDVIVSNPPYIRTKVIQELDEEVRTHDPFLALDGHEDGLYFYEAITKQSTAFIKQGGWLLYEIGYDQAEDVRNIMSACGFGSLQTVKDLAGLDRVVIGQKLINVD